jgi:tetratricopeptide (TPR) repeat protein
MEPAGVPASPPRTHDLFATLAICGLLLLAVMLVFSQTLGYGFVNYDDTYYVYKNPHLAHGPAESIPWAFTAMDCGNWHPLTWLSYILDHQLYGLAPWGYHLTNLLLHAAAAIALFLVLRRMTGDFWPSAFVAAVFAIHPLRAESVAWVSERKDVLSGLFFMLTLAAYVGYVRRPFSRARYGLVAVLFALGLMAKPMLVTLPLVLLLLDYWPLGRTKSWWRLVVEKLPLLALSAASCVVTPLAQSTAMVQLKSMPFSARIANALVSYVTYVGQFFYPVGLAVFYPHRGGSLPAWQIVAALLLLSGACFAAVVWRRRCPYVFVGWYWYVGMLVPAIGLVQVGLQAMADRYTYLPQIGLAMALAWGAKRAFASWPHRGRLLGGASALALAALMGCAYHQTSFWFDSETLWNRAIDCTRDNAVAHRSLGVVLADCGRLDDAQAEYLKALKIKPDDMEAHNNLGDVLASWGRVDEAVAQFDEALKTKPNFAEANYNLGIAFFRKGQIDAAIAQFRKALATKPDYADALNNLGSALASRREFDAAIAEYEKSLKANPNHAETHYNLGAALLSQGHVGAAIAQYEKALDLKPDYAKAHNNLGAVLARCGQMDEAVAHFRKAAELDPHDAKTRLNRDAAVAQWEAIRKQFAQERELLRQRPDDPALLNEVAWTLATNPNASLRNGAEAVELGQRAMKLTGGQQPTIVDTLAAAYAEAGQFPKAVETAEQALDLASGQSNAALADTLRTRLKLYQNASPYRESQQSPLP